MTETLKEPKSRSQGRATPELPPCPAADEEMDPHGVLVVADDPGLRTRFHQVCAGLGRPCCGATLADAVVGPVPARGARLAVVAAGGLDVPLGAVLDALHEAGVVTVALYGPPFGGLVHLLALELGYDHVWCESASDEALAVLVKHAGMRRPRAGAARVEDPMPPTELSVDTASLTCTVRGVPFTLGTSSLYTLKLLLDRAPHPVSRTEIEEVIPLTKAGRIGGTRVVDAHVSRLRQRLREVGAGGVRIVAIRGKGYRITTVRDDAPLPDDRP